MSREIKFRGLTAKGEWAYGLPHDDAPNSTAYYAEYSQRIAWLPDTGDYANVPIKNGTLCQFTGLKDLNMVEVFEGDILADPMLYPMPVVYDTYLASFVRLDTTGDVYVLNYQGIEVIGNIYQNPELLEAP